MNLRPLRPESDHEMLVPVDISTFVDLYLRYFDVHPKIFHFVYLAHILKYYIFHFIYVFIPLLIFNIFDNVSHYIFQ